VPPAQAFVTGRIVLQGSGVSLTIPPGKPEVVIGREDPVSNVFPEVDLESHNGLDNGVGRKHAKLVIQGGQTFLEDLQSVNGTSVRGQKLQPGQRVALNNGDEFILGRLKCTYYSS
jgi:pSer/pThr/pTyr-binding forkhead associated (FHA) protein